MFTQGTSAKANEPVSPRDGLSLVSRGYSTYPRNYDTAFDYNREIKVVHREQVANPAPLGLAAFGLTTALLQGSNTAITEPETSFFVYAFALFFGGLAQLLAGMWVSTEGKTAALKM